MNYERIERLWWKARIGSVNNHQNPEVLEKFAELIVRECMAICDDVSKKNNTAVDCWIEIKRTFRS